MADHDDVVVEGARRDASGCWRGEASRPRGEPGGARQATAATRPPAWRPPCTNRCTAHPSRGTRRTWLAAPSSAKAGVAGSGRCTAKRASSAKIRASTRAGGRGLDGPVGVGQQVGRRQVQAPVGRVGAGRHRGRVGGPHRRRRRAGREQLRGAPGGASRGPRRRRRRSPGAAASGRCGRSWGGSTPWGTPRASRARILAMPSRAAARGSDGLRRARPRGDVVRLTGRRSCGWGRPARRGSARPSRSRALGHEAREGLVGERRPRPLDRGHRVAAVVGGEERARAVVAATGPRRRTARGSTPRPARGSSSPPPRARPRRSAGRRPRRR